MSCIQHLEQQCCTALPSALHWKPGLKYLNGALSQKNRCNFSYHLLVPCISSPLSCGPTKGCHKLSHCCLGDQNNYDQHPSSLPATKKGIVLAEVTPIFEVGLYFLMTLQVNNSSKNWGSISKWCMTVINRELNTSIHLAVFLANPMPGCTKVHLRDL